MKGDPVANVPPRWVGVFLDYGVIVFMVIELASMTVRNWLSTDSEITSKTHQMRWMVAADIQAIVNVILVLTYIIVSIRYTEFPPMGTKDAPQVIVFLLPFLGLLVINFLTFKVEPMYWSQLLIDTAGRRLIFSFSYIE